MYYTKSNHLKHLSKEDLSVLMELCAYSNNLYNFGLYQVRQHYFKEKKYLTYFSNLKICKENENYRSIQAQISTRILQKVDIAMKSFFSLAKMVKKGSYPANKLKLPRYRDKGGLYELDIPGTIVVVKGDKMKMPMSRLYRSSHPDFENLWLPFPEDLTGKTLKMVRIIPLYNGLHFKIEYIYEEPVVDLGLDKAHAIGIDTGVNNLAACVTTLGTSFLIDGKRLKSRNWYWNKEHTRLLTIAQKQGLEYTKRLAHMTLRRSNFQKDIMKKAARYIINYCIEHNIGTVVCGSVSESHEPEKPFISIAFTTLSHTLEYLCEKYSMQFVSQDEAYSSQASFLDDDELPDYDPEHPYEGSFSGKRLHRGLYQSKDGSLINADLNGAANILRKCPLGFDLRKIDRKVLASPKRIDVL